MWASLQQDDPFSVLLLTHIHTLSLSHEASSTHHPLTQHYSRHPGFMTIDADLSSEAASSSHLTASAASCCRVAFRLRPFEINI
jgi:hypothetical protein